MTFPDRLRQFPKIYFSSTPAVQRKAAHSSHEHVVHPITADCRVIYRPSKIKTPAAIANPAMIGAVSTEVMWTNCSKPEMMSQIARHIF